MSYEAGVAAFKQKRYAEATRHLQNFVRTFREKPIGDEQRYIQAQIGLVKCYQARQRWDEAIALCEQLSTNENPILRQWSAAALQQLRTHQPIVASDAKPQVETELSETAQNLFFTQSLKGSLTDPNLLLLQQRLLDQGWEKPPKLSSG